jgi:DeoR/GlpR family transcriptional regulator of sugar metabolism
MPRAIKIDEIARTCSVNVRNVYRDLRALETEFKCPDLAGREKTWHC